MKEGKNASARRISGGRAITSPTASALDTESARARGLGDQPRVSAASQDAACGCPGRCPGRPFRAKETAPLETPAAVATSLIVGRPMRLTKPV